MSKAAPVSTVQREVKAGGHLLLYLVVGFVVLIMAGPALLNSAADGVVSAAGRTANGAVRDHTYPVPGNANRLSEPPPTTIPTAKPYGPPNGPVKPLPSQMPPPTIPPKSDLPTLEGGGGGGILGELPGVGPIINELGPGLAKALNP